MAGCTKRRDSMRNSRSDKKNKKKNNKHYIHFILKYIMSFFFSVYKTFKNNDFSICLRTFWRSTGVMLRYADLSWVTPTCEGTFPKPHPSAAAQLQFKLRSLCLSPTLSRQLAWWKDLRETIPVSDLVLHCQTRMTPHPSPPSPLCLHHLLLL